MTYISDLDHNPDFPFAAVGQSGVVYALFKYEEEADEFLETSSTGASKVIDTSPKPKREPTEGEVWMITEGAGTYASWGECIVASNAVQSRFFELHQTPKRSNRYEYIRGLYEEAREKSRVVNQRYDELKAKEGASNAVIEL